MEVTERKEWGQSSWDHRQALGVLLQAPSPAPPVPGCGEDLEVLGWAWVGHRPELQSDRACDEHLVGLLSLGETPRAKVEPGVGSGCTNVGSCHHHRTPSASSPPVKGSGRGA